ncbi:MAG: hypothetical protein AB8G22_06225 [Saprospiraceae bacterium]
MEEEPYGIQKEHAHKRAIELVPEEFFWDCVDELAPFGSDEGDMALSEYRRWRENHPNSPIYDCMKWVIEDVGEMKIDAYNKKLLDRKLISSYIKGEFFEHDLFTLDISVIATGFGQLVDEGKIDKQIKPLIQIAITRQKIWSDLAATLEDWDHSEEYINNLNILERVLREA